jgi:hypothetical protein
MADPKKSRTDREEPSARWETGESDLGRTVRMASAPKPSLRAHTIADEKHDKSSAKTSLPRAAGKSVELFVVDETQLPGGERKPWRAAEVWTKRRVYGLDSTFKCVEILDRETARGGP